MVVFLVTAAFLLATAGQAVVQQQNFVIYPAKAQSQQQMEMDKYECYTWAKQQTGFDPKWIAW
jgi:hypothetical protein